MADRPLGEDERAVYEWQLGVPGFGEEGQQRLKNASVLVSRIGGVGGLVAYQLAAAGVGKLVLAHAGDLRLNDLNRQLLMRHDGVGRSRIEQAAERLRQFNPHVELECVAENVSDANAERLVSGVDVVASCAPLFVERLAMNQAAVRLNRPLVDCSTYELQVQVMTVLPGRSACLACLYPEEPAEWRRQFPVFGATAGVAACLGAMEVIKLLAGFGEPLADRLLLGDVGDVTFRKLKVARRANCVVCASRRGES